MALSLYHLQNDYMMEIYRGQHGIGSYHVLSQYNSLAALPIPVPSQYSSLIALPIPDFTVYSPEDIVGQIKGNLLNGVETNCEDKVEVEQPKVNQEAEGLSYHPRK